MKKIFLIVFSIYVIAPTGVFAFDEAKVKQMAEQSIIIGFRGLTISNDSDIENILKNTNPGGVILFDYDSPSKGKIVRNFKNQKQVKSLINSIKKHEQDQVHPFISVDQEGGIVNRLKSKYGFSVQTPTAKKRASLGLKKTSVYENQMIKQLKTNGFNLNFGTVSDLDFGSLGVAIGKYSRSYSSKPNIVVEYSKQNINIHKKYSILGTIKHYPGHGSANADTHTDFVDVTDVFRQDELDVFKNLAKSVDAIMVAHIVNKNVDLMPASLSRKHIDILRKDFGYNGLIITDDLDMAAIRNKYSLGQAVVLAKKAGVDMVIISNNLNSYNRNAFFEARDELVKAVLDGTIDYNEFESSYNRVLSIKEKYKI